MQRAVQANFGQALLVSGAFCGQTLLLLVQQAVQVSWDTDAAQDMCRADRCHQMAKSGHLRSNLLSRPWWTALHGREQAQLGNVVKSAESGCLLCSTLYRESWTVLRHTQKGVYEQRQVVMRQGHDQCEGCLSKTKLALRVILGALPSPL